MNSFDSYQLRQISKSPLKENLSLLEPKNIQANSIPNKPSDPRFHSVQQKRNYQKREHEYENSWANMNKRLKVDKPTMGFFARISNDKSNVKPSSNKNSNSNGMLKQNMFKPKKIPSIFEITTKPTDSFKFLIEQENMGAKNSSSLASKSIINVNELLKKLTDHNILPKTAQKNKQAKVEEEKVPDLTSLEPELLKQKYQGAIQSLYSGIQCATCGNRFNQNESSGASSSNRYAKHLDWHFRQNKKEKDEVNKAHSRSWYYNLADWILYEELSQDFKLNEKKSERILHESNISKNKTSNQAIQQQECVASSMFNSSCSICNEPFKTYWNDEEEEWFYKNSTQLNNMAVHIFCIN